MVLLNLTPNFYNLSDGVALEGSGNVYINNSLYLGSVTLQNQIDQLFLRNAVAVSDYPDDFPVTVEKETDEKLPDNFEYGARDFIIFRERDEFQSMAALSVDINQDNINYGAVRLTSETGSEAGLNAFEDNRIDGMIYAYKNQNEDQRYFDVRTDGFRATIDISNASTEDIANLLIDLGLVDSA